MSPTAFKLHCLLVSLSLFMNGCGKSKPHDPASAELKARLNTENPSRYLPVVFDSVLSPGLLRHFYQRREFQPAWTGELGSLALVDTLVGEIRRSRLHGLNPDDYHLRSINRARSLLDSAGYAEDPSLLSLRADLDLLLTDAYVLYASHLAEGKIERDSMTIRTTIGSEWDRYATGLENALLSGKVGRSLAALAPRHEMYSDLRDLLQRYETEAERGGWGLIPSTTVLRPGESGRSVLLVRNRLRRMGYLTARGISVGDEYESTLVDAMRMFQQRHGLEQSGLADSATFVALNVSPARRVEQIKANLERWRWISHRLGSRHIRVNIPDFTLTVSEENRDVMTMKVVVGLPSWQTPAFSSEMNQVLFNAPWLAPKNIVEEELIEYMKADSDYLRRNEMSLWREVGDSMVMIHLSRAEISLIDPKEIDFRLRQEGGPQNIMGQVKFLIPNSYSVYLHDTPYREDFAKRVRMFSHGCIRLEKPFELAEYVLRDYPAWDRNQIDTVVGGKTKHSIYLKNPIPVHVVYCTVWKERDGSLQFRDDCYGLDSCINSILDHTSPRRPLSGTHGVRN